MACTSASLKVISRMTGLHGVTPTTVTAYGVPVLCPLCHDGPRRVYNHIDVTPAQVSSIELPVCIVFFPDLYEGNPQIPQGVDLKSVCREIFLVVNRNAKRVT